MMFYYVHPAVVYVNKFRVAGLLEDGIDQLSEQASPFMVSICLLAMGSFKTCSSSLCVYAQEAPEGPQFTYGSMFGYVWW
jgi:hypothetical protein